MDLVFAAFVAIFIGTGLLAALATLVIHPRVNQLLSGDWLPEPEGVAEVFKAQPGQDPGTRSRVAQQGA